MRRGVAAVLLLLGVWIRPALAVEKLDANIPLAPTFVTEGTLPATEVEAGFAVARSDTERRYELGFSSLQYAWDSTFGVKLAVPFTIVEPRREPATAGIGDVRILLKYVPILSIAELFALATGVTVTLPTGNEARGLGGTFAIAPALFAGKVWRLGGAIVSVQEDASYSWQISEPARVAPEEADGAPAFPDREQRLGANLTAAVAPVPWITGILELNTATVIAGDPRLRERVQVYLTPGVSVEPAAGWNVRVGVQVAVTRARALDRNVILLVTKGF